MRIIDLTGESFGRWTVLAMHPGRRSGHVVWLCRCDCGTERGVQMGSLRGGQSTNCGCMRRDRTTHGMSKTRVFNIWGAMRQRCLNPNTAAYPNYGGRGITVCKRWRSFENFYTDMGEPPPGKTLDRINNDGNYEPGNCRWATRVEQARNQRKRKARRAKLEDIRAYVDALARASSPPMRTAP